MEVCPSWEISRRISSTWVEFYRGAFYLWALVPRFILFTDFVRSTPENWTGLGAWDFESWDPICECCASCVMSSAWCSFIKQSDTARGFSLL
jgi:hypothetical protein